MVEDSKENVPLKDSSHVGMVALIWLFLAGLIALLLYLSYVFTSKEKKKKKNVPVPSASAENTARQVAGGRRPRRMRVQRDHSDSDDEIERFNEDGDLDNLVQDDEQGKVGVKKARKRELKAEKKAQREAQLQEREDKKQRDALLEAERKKDDEQKAHDAEERAERERLEKEEEDRKEYEEYLQIKASFVVEESGEVGILTEEESQSLLQEFIDYVKNSKVVLLEELGARFNLKTQEAIERLEHLLEIGRLTGVMDDRGKFIYISEEELQQVAKFIKQRGRISIAELAESSNALINMHGCKNENTIVAAT